MRGGARASEKESKLSHKTRRNQAKICRKRSTKDAFSSTKKRENKKKSVSSTGAPRIRAYARRMCSSHPWPPRRSSLFTTFHILTAAVVLHRAVLVHPLVRDLSPGIIGVSDLWQNTWGCAAKSSCCDERGSALAGSAAVPQGSRSGLSPAGHAREPGQDRERRWWHREGMCSCRISLLLLRCCCCYCCVSLLRCYHCNLVSGRTAAQPGVCGGGEEAREHAPRASPPPVCEK